MTAAEMRFYLKNLATTGQTQGHALSHGVGAKISAGYRNPLGVQYRFSRDGAGTQVVFCKLPPRSWRMRTEPTTRRRR